VSCALSSMQYEFGLALLVGTPQATDFHATASADKVRSNYALSVDGNAIVAEENVSPTVPWCGMLLCPATMTVRVCCPFLPLCSACAGPVLFPC
jgi:hypothetical protein